MHLDHAIMPRCESPPHGHQGLQQTGTHEQQPELARLKLGAMPRPLEGARVMNAMNRYGSRCSETIDGTFDHGRTRIGKPIDLGISPVKFQTARILHCLLEPFF